MKPCGRLSKQTISVLCVVALLAASYATGLAQQTAPKRALTHRDYDSWHSIQSPQISRDGKFIAYAFMAQDGDSEIVVRNLATGAEWRAGRGYRPPAPLPDDSIPNVAELIAAQARLARPAFTADSRFVIFAIEPTKADLTKAKKEKKKPEDMPKNALGIMDTSTGKVTRIEKVKNFQAPEDGSGFIAYLLEPKLETKKPDEKTVPPSANENAQPNPSASPANTSASPRGSSPTVREGAPSTPRTPKKKEYGSDLVLRNLTAGTERIFNDALDYTLSKDAKTLVFAVSAKKEDTNGVYSVTTQTDAAPASLLSGKGKFQKLTWDEDKLNWLSSATVTTPKRSNRSTKFIFGTAAEMRLLLKARIAITPVRP
jgi:hypothetical protein